MGGCEKESLPVRKKTVSTGCEMQDQNFYLFDFCYSIIGILVILYAFGIAVVYSMSNCVMDIFHWEQLLRVLFQTHKLKFEVLTFVLLITFTAPVIH